MKKLLFLLIVSYTSVLTQNLPLAGKIFRVEYNPSAKGIFSNESKPVLVYTFDTWGTKYTYHSGKNLFKNVLEPDPGQKHETVMNLNGNTFTADILIPDTAQLLSYYITDGKSFDYNNEKTYVSYIYNENKKPVKGARFRNVDFLIMADAESEEYISELENEVKDYPDYHLARAILWGKKLETSKALEEILLVKDEFEKEFAELRNEYPDDYDFMNAEARVYFSFQIAVSNIINPYFLFAQNKIFEIAEKIPDGKRSSIVERTYQARIKQLNYEKLKEEIIGKPGIDFDFTSITGERKKLSDFKGKTVLLDFWGTWCGPCVVEIPNLVSVYKKYKDKGFEIISVSSDLMTNSKNEDEFKEFIAERNMEWIHILDDQTIHNLYNISHWPTLFLIDKNGIVIKNETTLRGSLLEETIKEVTGSIEKQ